GGSVTKGLIDGWWEVSGCVVQRLKSLPAALHGATQLLATMQPPTIGVAGGIRVPDGFYRFEQYFPYIHAFGASRVSIITDGGPVPCPPSSETGGWNLPAFAVPQAGTVVVRAEWPQDGGSARAAEARIKFVDYVLDDELKPLRTGTYLLEGCGT